MHVKGNGLGDKVWECTDDAKKRMRNLFLVLMIGRINENPNKL